MRYSNERRLQRPRAHALFLSFSSKTFGVCPHKGNYRSRDISICHFPCISPSSFVRNLLYSNLHFRKHTNDPTTPPSTFFTIHRYQKSTHLTTSTMRRLISTAPRAASTLTSRSIRPHTSRLPTPLLNTTTTRSYHEKVLDHYSSPRNVGSMSKTDTSVGTGLVGAPACGDVMKLQIKVNPDTDTIEDVKFKTFGCGSAIASSSYLTELVS